VHRALVCQIWLTKFALQISLLTQNDTMVKNEKGGKQEDKAPPSAGHER